MEYYREPLPERSGLRYRGSMIRALPTSDVDISLEFADENGVTVELGEI